MSFDSGFLAASLREINEKCRGARVEKIYQPRADRIDICLRTREGSRRLVFVCGAGGARVSLSAAPADNPPVPPGFCMQLRKHLQGGLFGGAVQIGFERVAEFDFSCRDELGFECERRLFAEITGRNSNLIFTDGDLKILGAVRVVDFSTSRVRQVLPGMKYELPPAQEGRKDPLAETREGFLAAFFAADPAKSAASFINSSYLGICPAVAAETVFRACGRTDSVCADVDGDLLWTAFSGIVRCVKDGSFSPCVAFDGKRPVEFSYLPLTHYGEGSLRMTESPSAAADLYFGERDREAFVTARAADLKRTLSTVSSRLVRKLEIQEKELAGCEEADGIRRDAELIVANIYTLKKGDSSARLTDYSETLPDGSFPVRTVRLDPMLSPSANAQKLFKKYAKLKTARTVLTEQIRLGRAELEYIETVKDAMSRAETGADVGGIRAELEKGGYIRAKKGAAPSKPQKSAPAKYLTSGGFTVLCGKNNLQNEEITFRMSEKGDIWFHAKGVPGSHVLLKSGGREVPDRDIAEAAAIAARNSDSGNEEKVAVDYTDVKNVKKPAGSKPGYVIYHTNRTAVVSGQ